MRNSELSFTALSYNAHLNVISYKAGMSKYKASINDLLNKCYTDATIMAAKTNNTRLSNGCLVSDYTVKIPKGSAIKELFSAPKKIYFNADAFTAEKVFAESKRAISNDTDVVDGEVLKLMTPEEYDAACLKLTTGQFPIELESVDVAKSSDTTIDELAVVQKTVGKNVHCYLLKKNSAGEGSSIYSMKVCKAMDYQTEHQVEGMLVETFEMTIGTVFEQLTGRDPDNSYSGINPFKRVTDQVDKA